MSTGFPKLVNLRSYDVLNRWVGQLRRLFADHYGPHAGITLVRKAEDWRLATDGVDILDTVESNNPLIDLWTSLVTGQSDRFGDGVTFAALFALALTDRAETLVDRGLHPTTIQRGYETAFDTTRSHLADAAVERDDAETLTMLLDSVAAGESLSSPVTVDAVATAVAHDESKFPPQLLTRNAGDKTETEAFPGVLITKKTESDISLPLTDVRVLLIDERLYFDGAEEDDSRSRTVPKVSLSVPEDLSRVDATLRDRYEEWVDAIVDVDPDVVVTLKGVAEVIKQRLATEGITLIHRAKPTDVMGRLAASTGATVVSNVTDVDPAQLGTADKVSLREFNDLEYVTVRGRSDGPWTLLVRHWTWSAVEHAGDTTDALLAVGERAADERTYLPGAGGAETDAAAAVRDRSRSIGEREALAVRAYADALEDTVIVLARNLGRNPTESLTLLRNAPQGTGLVGDRGESGNALMAGAVELASVKRGAVAAATNTALTVLRVDALATGGG